MLVDGFDVWEIIFSGIFLFRIEFFYNIDFFEKRLGFLLIYDIWYSGVVICVGDMKLLMYVFNVIWY